MDKSKTIIVHDSEAALVQQANEIQARALSEARKREEEIYKESQKAATVPMLFYETAENAQIIEEEEALRTSYQTKLQLVTKPILIPALPSKPAAQPFGGGLGPPVNNKRPAPPGGQFPPQDGSFHLFERQKDGPPIPEELKDRFLQAVPAYRVGDRLYLWENGRYCYFSDNEAKARIKSVLRSNIYITNATAVLNSVLTLLKVEENIVGEPDNFPHLVSVQNGEIDLNTMTLHPATPAHFLTHYLNVWWGGPQPCPVFTAFLNRTTGGDPELRQRLLETIGYLLVPDYRPKRFVVFQGAGDCGKSVLGNLIASFFERGNAAALADYQFGERFALSFIANALLCLCMDLSGGTIDAKAVSVLKQVTGGDMVSIEAKGKDAYSDHIRCKLLFGTNFPIRLKCKDQAFARRLLLVPFLYPVPPEEQDRDLLTKLMAERPGILFQALTAYRNVVLRDFQFTGEERFGFKAEQIVVDEPQPNAVAVFAENCCVFDNGETFTTTQALHAAYLNFCAVSGFPAISNRASFSHALRVYLGERVKPEKRRVGGDSINGYWGIKLRRGCEANV